MALSLFQRYRPRLLPSLAALAGVALFVHLGLWQQGKADRSEATAALAADRGQQAPRAMDGRLVDGAQAHGLRFEVRGEFDAARQFFIDNRQHEGIAGLHVVTPLKIAGSDTQVLVNRGWIAWPRERGVLPHVAVPPGELVVTGRADLPSSKPYFLIRERPEADPRLRNRLDPIRHATETARPVQPVVLLADAQQGASGVDGLVRQWQPLEDRTFKHRGYALQWFLLAVGLIVFHTVASLRR